MDRDTRIPQKAERTVSFRKAAISILVVLLNIMGIGLTVADSNPGRDVLTTSLNVRNSPKPLLNHLSLLTFSRVKAIRSSLPHLLVIGDNCECSGNLLSGVFDTHAHTCHSLYLSFQFRRVQRSGRLLYAI